ncbi:hypothetical protein K438DRAFT_1854785 [Mycena galopus ATCC 62051]|nr:hypothetical protein K438DRAFT_1854785 [Mycena galopus ATCC 62051]
MRVPAELIHAIINQVDVPNHWVDVEDRETLQSCALAARLCLRPSQKRLFRWLSPAAGNHIRRLSAVLESSPHLGGYVRTLELSLCLNSADFRFAVQLLHVVTALETLVLQSAFLQGSFPFDCKVVMILLPTLRRVELGYYKFHDPFELESLLKDFVSLRELKLMEIEFINDGSAEKRRRNTARKGRSRHSPRILESLTLVRIQPTTVESMLECFTTVDIKHLKSLSSAAACTPIASILRASACSICNVTIDKCLESRSYSDNLDPNILACENNLNTINVHAMVLEEVLTSLPLFGHLENLPALNTIRIVLRGRLDRRSHKLEEWEELEALLSHTLTADINIYGSFGDRANRMEAIDIETVRKWLPSLSSSGRLHIFPLFKLRSSEM